MNDGILVLYSTMLRLIRVQSSDSLFVSVEQTKVSESMRKSQPGEKWGEVTMGFAVLGALVLLSFLISAGTTLLVWRWKNEVEKE